MVSVRRAALALSRVSTRPAVATRLAFSQPTEIVELLLFLGARGRGARPLPSCMRINFGRWSSVGKCFGSSRKISTSSRDPCPPLIAAHVGGQFVAQHFR